MSSNHEISCPCFPSAAQAKKGWVGRLEFYIVSHSFLGGLVSEGKHLIFYFTPYPKVLSV